MFELITSLEAPRHPVLYKVRDGPESTFYGGHLTYENTQTMISLENAVRSVMMNISFHLLSVHAQVTLLNQDIFFS